MAIQSNFTTPHDIDLTASYGIITQMRWAGSNNNSPLTMSVDFCVWKDQAAKDAEKQHVELRTYSIPIDLESGKDIVTEIEDWILANDSDFSSGTKV